MASSPRAILLLVLYCIVLCLSLSSVLCEVTKGTDVNGLTSSSDGVKQEQGSAVDGKKDIKEPDDDDDEEDEEEDEEEYDGMEEEEEEADEEEEEEKPPEDEEDPEKVAAKSTIPVGDDGPVVALTSATFKSYILSHKYVLVEFYAPWCTYCQSLAPEIRGVAADLIAHNVHVCKVDAIKEEKLAEDYNVGEFPEIFLFIEGIRRKFRGEPSRANIVKWVIRKFGPPVETIESKEHVDKLLAESKLISVGLFDKLEGAEYKAYQDTAVDDDIRFIQTTSASIASLFGVQEAQRPALALFKIEESRTVRYKGDFGRNDLLSWFASNKLPTVITLSEKTSSIIFESKINKQIFLMASDANFKAYLKPFESVALEIDDALFIHVNSSDPDTNGEVLEYFGVTPSEVKVGGFFLNEADSVKYRMEEPITEENIKIFTKSVISGEAKVFYKSEVAPEKNDGPVKVVVGSTFEEIVLDESKDVFLMVYAPWCDHCKKMAPVIDRLGEKFSSIDSVVICKFDGTQNEHPSLKVEGYPGLFMYPAGNKTGVEPIKVTGSSYRYFVSLILEQAKIKFTLPKRKGKPAKEATEKGSEGYEKDEL